MKSMLILWASFLCLFVSISHGQDLSDEELAQKYGIGAEPTYWLVPAEPGEDTGNLALLLEGRVGDIGDETFEVHGLFGLTDSELWGVQCALSGDMGLDLFSGAYIRFMWDGRQCEKITVLSLEDMLVAKIYLELGRRQPYLSLE